MELVQENHVPVGHAHMSRSVHIAELFLYDTVHRHQVDGGSATL